MACVCMYREGAQWKRFAQERRPPQQPPNRLTVHQRSSPAVAPNQPRVTPSHPPAPMVERNGRALTQDSQAHTRPPGAGSRGQSQPPTGQALTSLPIPPPASCCWCRGCWGRGWGGGGGAQTPAQVRPVCASERQRQGNRDGEASSIFLFYLVFFCRVKNRAPTMSPKKPTRKSRDTLIHRGHRQS